MLSLDGAEHDRHRDPFAHAFRVPEVRRRFTDSVSELAGEIVDGLAPAGQAELRRDLAGPLAVGVMALALDLVDGDPATLARMVRRDRRRRHRHLDRSGLRTGQWCHPP